VKVTTNPSDRRGRHLTLTRPGATLLAQAVPIWERTHMEVTALFEDANCLRSTLRTLS
jgi:DNA-binding MarR family transcriptional regulator